jgi:hypothetical protein
MSHGVDRISDSWYRVSLSIQALMEQLLHLTEIKPRTLYQRFGKMFDSASRLWKSFKSTSNNHRHNLSIWKMVSVQRIWLQ